METVAIIPARGGSKGIPRKNIRRLAGKPLLAHTIAQARLAQRITRVIVSTDDQEIADVAVRYSAEVVWRPETLSGDMAASEAALLHVLETLASEEAYHPDLLVFLQCTSPLTLAEDIDGTVDAMIAEEADTAVTVVPYHYFLWRPDAREGGLGINHEKHVRPLRQQRELQYQEVGAVYAMRAPGFLAARHRFFGKTALYAIPQERRLEIDDPVDFTIAEVMLRERDRQRHLALLPSPVQGLVFDFDGVFTDNRVVVQDDGREAVICHRGDGMGITLLRELGIPVLVLSTEVNPVVDARCRKLQLQCLQGVTDKGVALQSWLETHFLDARQVVYVGNDVNDLPCMRLVGCTIVPADAHLDVRAQAAIILEACGGQGAVREVADLILQQRG